jgi:hypothetical protein
MGKRQKLLSILPAILIFILFSGLSPFSGMGRLTQPLLDPLHQITGIPRNWPFFAGEPFWFRYDLYMLPSGKLLTPKNEQFLSFLGIEREKNLTKSILISWSNAESKERIVSWICKYHSNVPKGRPVEVGYRLMDLDLIRKKIAEGSLYSFYFSKAIENKDKTIEVKCLD